jgi:hypothetical protein
MGSTVGTRYASGSVVATGAVINIRVVDFKPRSVVIKNRTSLCQVQWNETMADAYGWKQVAAGTRTLEAAAGVTPLDATSTEPPGFSLGAMADVNDTTTEILEWEARG